MSSLTHKLITRFLFKKAFYGKSLVHGDRLKFLCSLLEKAIYENIPGNVIECGVYRGGSLMELGKVLKRLNSKKALFGLDTFAGHPYTDDGTIHVKGYLGDSNIELVQYALKRAGLEETTLLQGKFIDMLPFLEDQKFCFAHLDCDLYESYRECLSFLLPRMSKNGIIWLDDYNSDSALLCNKAVHEYIPRNKLVILPHKQAYHVVR